MAANLHVGQMIVCMRGSCRWFLSCDSRSSRVLKLEIVTFFDFVGYWSKR
jgi:hypothetical protein